MRITIFILALLTSLSSVGQGPTRRMETLRDLLLVNPRATSTASSIGYDVASLETNRPWGGLRHVVWKPTSTLATNTWSVFACPFGGRWVFQDADATEVDARWLGLVGDGVTDNSQSFSNIQNLIGSSPVKVMIPGGTYNVSTPISFRGNYPIRVGTVAGFGTGWNATNAITEARIVYTGPPTNIFFDVHPTVGVIYGVNLDGLTIDAGGNAAIAANIERCSRGDIHQLRVANSTDIGLKVENSYFINFENFSCSHNEIPFTTRPAVGLMLTNQANVNVFLNPNISGVTNWCIVIDGLSFNNSIIGGGVESSLGGGVLFGSGARFNELDGTWFELNQDTDRFIVVDPSSLFNSISRCYFENRIGKVVVNGSYTSIRSSSFGDLEFGASSGNNNVSDVILGIGVHPSGHLEYQNIVNLIDATTDIRTNIVQNNQAFYGEVLDMVNGVNQYPSARIERDRIMFGNGTNGFPNVGWYRASDVSIGTTNTIVQIVATANSGLWTAYVSGDSNPRTAFYPGAISLGGGSSTPSVNLSWLSANTILSDSGILTIRSSPASSLLGGYTSGSAQPSFFTTINGTQTWGAGGTNATDTSLYRYLSGSLRIDNALYIGTTNVIDSISSMATNGHSHDGRYVLSTNGFSTNLTSTGTTTINGTLIATNIGSDLASAGAHRIIVREAATMNLRPMTASYLKGLLDIHASDIVDSGSLGRSIVTNASISGLMPLIGSGTPNSSVWLRGDGTWSTPPTSGSATNGILDVPVDDVMYGRLNGGWVGLDMQYVTGVSTYMRSILEALDESEFLQFVNLTGGTPTTINSPAVHVTRINSGGTESARHRLNLIAGSGISLDITDDSVDDEADIQISSSLSDGSVALSKIENVTAGKLLGRTTASTGPPQEITPGAGLLMSGTTLSVDQSSFTSGQILYASSSDVSLNGASFTHGSWTNILGPAKIGTSLTIPANTLTSGSTLEIRLAGTMAFDDGTDNNKVRVTVGGLTFTFTFEEVDGFASLTAPWDITCMVTVKTSGTSLLSVIKGTGWWNWTTIEGFKSPTQSSYYGYRTRPVIAGSLDTTVPLTISAEFFGDNSTSLNSAQFTEFDCNHAIATRY